MRPFLTYVGFGLVALVSAAPSNKQHNRVVACQVGVECRLCLADRFCWGRVVV